MSVRTALAKHSWNNFRNQVYFKIGLTAISAATTIWFGGTYLYGSEEHAWKGITCGVATIACFLSLFSTSSELKKWRQMNALERASRMARANRMNQSSSDESDA
jgi:hypothetical protein